MPTINDATYYISMEEISHKMNQNEVPLCDNIELVCTGESKVVGKNFSNKRGNLLFFSEEKVNVLKKQMLTDESINIAQNILKKQFSKTAGLQDTVTGKTQAFDIMRNEEKYIQILHAGSFHWICVPNMQRNKTDNSYCQIYNCSTNGNLPLDVAKQMAAFS